ncbi:MAG: signal recognition particle-docking protein FtsY [Chloroflexi bacterium HGW-Chloroflexi-5]|jgi:fused signal recognition particle receptor|nr:MAG: signal recognition particle-docking protein FtsY [Chloroflexi bacterium HGW-Chloroflexi-5]
MADNIFAKWKEGLDRTRKSTFGRIATLFGATEIKEETWEELEELLIQADLGVETTMRLVKKLKSHTSELGLTKSSELQQVLHDELLSLLKVPEELPINGVSPAVILLVGVNGSGKTTTAAKLGKLYTQQGKKVLLAAADTFRAAAIDQLQVWADRLGLQVVAGQPESDSGAVAYDAVQAAIARKFDIVLIDTAGRLHTRYNLMEELKKVHRVVGKAMPGAPHAVLLVLDATTGQNALHQAKAFQEAVQVNGVILSKLDSSARGGMAFAIQHELNLPIFFAGLGEKPEDLTPFDPEAFVKNILLNQN